MRHMTFPVSARLQEPDTSVDAVARRLALALAVRPDGLPRLPAPDDALARGRARGARRGRTSARRSRSSSPTRATCTSSATSSSCASEGREVVEIELPKRTARFEEAHAATVAAMRAGADVIYQATFARDGWRGRADFVVRVDEPSDLGAWSYEPYDTKLARSAKPAAVLQLAWYAREIAAVQGRLPERLHVVLGTSEVETLPAGRCGRVPARRAAAAARARRAADPRPTRGRASTARAATSSPSAASAGSSDDHLTRVASIRRDQIGKLAHRRRHDADGSRPRRRPASPFAASRRRWSRSSATRRRSSSTATAPASSRYRLLAPEERRGLGLLPAPSPGDVFFDMEGDPFYDPACGLEFLFGVLWREPGRHDDVPSLLGARPRRRSVARSKSSSISSASAGRRFPTCTSTTTPPTSPRRSPA